MPKLTQITLPVKNESTGAIADQTFDLKSELTLLATSSTNKKYSYQLKELETVYNVLTDSEKRRSAIITSDGYVCRIVNANVGTYACTYATTLFLNQTYNIPNHVFYQTTSNQGVLSHDNYSEAVNSGRLYLYLF